MNFELCYGQIFINFISFSIRFFTSYTKYHTSNFLLKWHHNNFASLNFFQNFLPTSIIFIYFCSFHFISLHFILSNQTQHLFESTLIIVKHEVGVRVFSIIKKFIFKILNYIIFHLLYMLKLSGSWFLSKISNIMRVLQWKHCKIYNFINNIIKIIIKLKILKNIFWKTLWNIDLATHV